jgi:hypothetical protein
LPAVYCNDKEGLQVIQVLTFVEEPILFVTSTTDNIDGVCFFREPPLFSYKTFIFTIPPLRARPFTVFVGSPSAGGNMKMMSLLGCFLVSSSFAWAQPAIDSCVTNVKKAAENLAMLNDLNPSSKNTTVEPVKVEDKTVYEVTTVSDDARRTGTFMVTMSSIFGQCRISSVVDTDAQ